MDIKELDPGHCYRLVILDGEQTYTPPSQNLQFVKREGSQYPGNLGHYPGTNLQSVLRACGWRLSYLHQQHWSIENFFVAYGLLIAVWWVEVRAARRHGRWYWHTPWYAFTSPMCPTCGHTDCREHRKETAEPAGANAPRAC